MKKGLLIVILLAIAAFLLYQFVFKKDKTDHQKEVPMTVKGTDTLTGDIGETLQAYYNMKDAFTRSDSVQVTKDAAVLTEKVGRINFSGIKADAAVIDVATQLRKDINSEMQNLQQANTLLAKRKSFQVVSDGLFDLLRTIRYDGSKVYQQYCPMAFDNAGAAWLSNSTDIVNPYFGDKMLHCGDVRDSVVVAKN